jgi:hypothetical protein
MSGGRRTVNRPNATPPRSIRPIERRSPVRYSCRALQFWTSLFLLDWLHARYVAEEAWLLMIRDAVEPGLRTAERVQLGGRDRGGAVRRADYTPAGVRPIRA